MGTADGVSDVGVLSDGAIGAGGGAASELLEKVGASLEAMLDDIATVDGRPATLGGSSIAT